MPLVLACDWLKTKLHRKITCDVARLCVTSHWSGDLAPYRPSGIPSGKANLAPHSLVLEVYTRAFMKDFRKFFKIWVCFPTGWSTKIAVACLLLKLLNSSLTSRPNFVRRKNHFFQGAQEEGSRGKEIYLKYWLQFMILIFWKSQEVSNLYAFTINDHFCYMGGPQKPKNG